MIPLVLTGQAEQAYSMAQRSVRNMENVERISPAIARGFDRRLGLALVFAGDYVKAVQVLQDVQAREEQAGLDKGGAHGTTFHSLERADKGATTPLPSCYTGGFVCAGPPNDVAIVPRS